MYHFIHVLRHKIIKNEIMTLYVLTCSFYQKTSRSKVFPYEVPVWMNCSRTFYNHFENFRKIKFQWERIFEKPLAFCEFSLYFQFENGFELTKDRRTEIRGSFWCRAYFFPIVSYGPYFCFSPLPTTELRQISPCTRIT